MNLNVTMLGQIITFVLFVLFCMRYIWPPLIGVIESRQKEISDNLMSVELVKKESYMIRTNADEYLQKAKIKAREIIKQASIYESRLIEEAQIKAKCEYDRILADAKKEIIFERNCMRDDLLHHFSSLVFSGVEKIVKRKLDSVIDDQSIINDCIKEL